MRTFKKRYKRNKQKRKINANELFIILKDLNNSNEKYTESIE